MLVENELLSQVLDIAGNLTLISFMLWRITKQDNELDLYRNWFIRRQEIRDNTDSITSGSKNTTPNDPTKL